MDFILIGKVSTLPTAREHLDVHGRAYCGAGRGIIAAATRWRVDATVTVAGICRRCLKMLRRLLGEAAERGDVAAAGAAVFLAPVDPAGDAAIIAGMRAHIRRMQAPAPTPLERSGLDADTYRRRLLASLSDDAPADALFAA